jgi:streptomycin 6-kinase
VTTTPPLTLPVAYADGKRNHMKEAAEPWLAALPGHIQDVIERWDLTVETDSPLLHGYCGVVIPVRRADGGPAMLKVGFVDDYTRGEATGLRVWNGQGAVRLFESDMTLDPAPDAGVGALLMERLDPERSLHQVPDDDGAQITGTLLARLAASPAGGVDLRDVLAQESIAAKWTAELRGDWEDLGRPCPDWMLDATLAACRDLGADHPGSVVHIDLHQANVLGGTREPWLAIDPQVMLGDPAFCLVPFLRNRWSAVAEAPEPRKALLRRFDILTETAGLDRERCRAWAVARAVEDLLFATRYGDDEEVITAAGSAQIAEWLSG